MELGDNSISTIVIKLLCISASIVIGVLMVRQSYINALRRRSALIEAVGKGLPKVGIAHLGALIINMAVIWFLCASVIALLIIVAGQSLANLTDSRWFVVSVAFTFLPIAYLILSGASLTKRLK